MPVAMRIDDLRVGTGMARIQRTGQTGARSLFLFHSGGSVMHKLLYLALVALLGSASVQAGDTVRVRMESSAGRPAESQSIRPLNRVDYGSFQVLELSAADAAKLAGTAGVTVLTDAGRIRFNQVDFDPLTQAERIGNGVFPTTASGEGLHLVQFDAPIKQEWRDALEERGLRVLQYYPGETFLVWGSIDSVTETVGQPNVRWQGGFLADYKINPNLDGRSGRIRNVDVTFYNNGTVDAVVGALEKLGGKVMTYAPAQPDKALFDAWVEVDADKLETIARMPEVLALSYASPEIGYDSELAAQIVAGNYNAALQPQPGYLPWLTGFGFNGSGVTWAATDSGVDLGHPDLSSRIVGGFSYPGCGSPNGDDEQGGNIPGGHGTHVAGIIAGSGFGDGAGTLVDEDDDDGFRYGQGIAPGASLYAVCVGPNLPPIGGYQSYSKNSLAASAIGMNASWHSGEPVPNGYSASVRTFDTMIRDGNFDAAGSQPFMVVFSAGNNGPGASTMNPLAGGKNTISVASSNNGADSDPAYSIDTIASYSSRGPSLDGRVLPTIAAPGEGISSTMRRVGASACAHPIVDTNSYYAYCSGTSMAAPQVSGALAVLAQWWRSNNSGATFSPAMGKALLINGAVDMGDKDVPNTAEGWGRIHLAHSASSALPRHFIDQSVVLDNTGDVHAFAGTIADPGKPVRITLVYTDAPGAVGASPALVNNLDLEVSNGGNLYRGNVITAGVSTTGGSADALNNAENVFLPAGASGAISVTVRATSLPGDGVPGVGDATDQDFALICDNCAVPDYRLTLSPVPREFCGPGPTTFDVSVGSVVGYTSPVALSLSGVPAGASANVAPTTVTPPGSATITLTPGSLAAGIYHFTLNGTSVSGARTVPVGFDLSTGVPVAPALTTPANNATGVAIIPTLVWGAATQGKSYVVEVASDAAFANIVFTQSTGSGRTATLDHELETNTHYYWRVRSSNICGGGANSAVFTFRTAATFGDCDDTQQANPLLVQDVEGATTGWTTTAGTGSALWAVSSTRPFSGTKSWLATDVAVTTDQYLVSPAVTLPAGQTPVGLSFRSDITSDALDASNCFDGGLLEVSTNGGGSWTQVGDALMNTPYNGVFVGGSPAVDNPAWCGTIPYRKTAVNLDSFAGQTVRFRFRFASDWSVGAAPLGWFVDDIKVQSCRGVVDLIFANGFES
jgi:Subtilase family